MRTSEEPWRTVAEQTPIVSGGIEGPRTALQPSYDENRELITMAFRCRFCRPWVRGRCVPGPAEEPQPGTLAGQRAWRAAQRAALTT